MRVIHTAKSVFERFRYIIAYLFFGACSMVANLVAYYICYQTLGISNIFSTAIAWFVAVLFAFITNKLWVFESKSFGPNVIVRELVSFFGCRVATGLLDLCIMFVSVDCFAQNEMLWKTIANVVVIVLNYASSRLIVFRVGKDKEQI